MSMEYLSTYACLQFLSSISHSFQYTSLSPKFKCQSEGQVPARILLGGQKLVDAIFVLFPPAMLKLVCTVFFFFPGGSHLCTPLCLALDSRYHLHALHLLHSRASVSLRGELLHAPVFMNGDLIFVAATHAMPLDCLAGDQGSLCSWVPQDCNNWRDSYWPTTILKALHRQHIESHPQSFCKRGLCACIGAHRLEGQI